MRHWKYASRSDYIPISLRRTINSSYIILKPLPESLSLQAIHFHDTKKREVMISPIYFLLLKDTNWRAPLCGSHKEGREQEGCRILNAQRQMALQNISRATKHLSTPVRFIYGFRCARAGCRLTVCLWKMLFKDFPLFIPFCKSLPSFLER